MRRVLASHATGPIDSAQNIGSMTSAAKNTIVTAPPHLFIGLSSMGGLSSALARSINLSCLDGQHLQFRANRPLQLVEQRTNVRWLSPSFWNSAGIGSSGSSGSAHPLYLPGGANDKLFRREWGGVAQLGERSVRNAEVGGSIPLASTTTRGVTALARWPFLAPHPVGQASPLVQALPKYLALAKPADPAPRLPVALFATFS